MSPPPYAPPAWGAEGANPHGVSLEVIKGGVVVQALALPVSAGRSFTLAGRMTPTCDLALQHASVSRVHAALQFDTHGALFVRDLGSTHGTFVNKRRVSADEFVRLHIGDVLAFGESTRLYAVCGPQELLPPERQSSRKLKAEKHQEEEAGASWGFREDAQEEEEEEEEDEGGKKEQLPDYLRNLKEEDTPYKSTVRKEGLNDKDQRLFQQLQAKITKMENLKQEKSRILAKQHQLSGLTDGQQQQLARNEQRIDALMREIEVTEEKIHAKNAQREQTAISNRADETGSKKKKSANEALYGYDSDEDDFYDRTRSNQLRHEQRRQQVAPGGSRGISEPVVKAASVSKGDALTASSIEAKIRLLEDDLAAVKKRIAAIEMKELAQNVDERKEEEVDSLDSFMDATSKQLIDSDRDAVTRRKVELEKELTRQRQLLAIAIPALPSVPSTDPLTTPQAQEKPSRAQSEDPDIHQRASLPTPSKEKVSESQEERNFNEFGAACPSKEHNESGKGAQSGASKPPPVPTESDRPLQEAERSTSRKAAVMTRQSGSDGRPSHRESARDSKKRRVSGPALPRGPAKPVIAGDTNVLEGGDRVWVPPKNQTGDGRTALNDKFGY